ncbi:MAG: pyrimidine-nucleoside phosphorylase [Lachnospiraceae bacterium]|nr:pyrimidine-nucleoside phosphorylase [Lachnospiraceae bacterium]
MRMYDLIAKKRDGMELDAQEIAYIIRGYVKGDIPDYQMSAFLMAVYFRGMTEQETLIMTNEVAKSGDMVDLSAIKGIKVDKHSTGGVGDKTTLIVAPIVASCGVKVAKMSGRGLGHTGGTVDKLESIPGYRTNLSQEEFFRVVNETGLSVIGQSGNLTPADKKMYALRDVTATVDNIPLIAVSIMSKKLAAGSDCILLDVKTGSGAFMKTLDDSIALAQEMVKIGENAGRKTVALITDMDTPLGNYIGNSLEVIEAVDTLNGKGPEDLTTVCLHLAANMMVLAGIGTLDACLKKAQNAIEDKSALQRLIAMVEAQGGDASVIKDTEKFAKARYMYEVKALKDGYVTKMDTEKCGIASVLLGAGREKKDSPIDFSAGIVLHKKTGDAVKTGDVLATLYASDEKLFVAAEEEYRNAVTIEKTQVLRNPLIYARITKEGVEKNDI